MKEQDLLRFIEENFYIDFDGELQFRFREDTPALIKKGHLKWLAERGLITDYRKPRQEP